jgi:CDGSH-type Zn-finger protein
MPEVPAGPVLTVKPNGPVLVPGPFTLVDPTGKTQSIPAGKTVAFCRCGQAAVKPFCDGSHGRTGFQAADAAPIR